MIQLFLIFAYFECDICLYVSFLCIFVFFQVWFASWYVYTYWLFSLLVSFGTLIAKSSLQSFHDHY